MEFTDEQLKEAQAELRRRDAEQSRKHREDTRKRLAEHDRRQREAEERHWLKMEAAYPGIDHDTLYSIYADMRDFYE